MLITSPLISFGRARLLTIALGLVAALVATSAPAPARADHRCRPKIKEVFFPGDDTMQVLGNCLSDGYAGTVVRFGEEGLLSVASESNRELIVALTPDLPDGNYRLTVRHRGGKAQWLAALASEGSQGPPGPEGRDLTTELCALYALTSSPPPQSLITELPEMTCDDNLDNDCNGFVDTADASCVQEPPMCMVNSDCGAPPALCRESVCEDGNCQTRNSPNGTQCGPNGEFCLNGTCGL